MKEIILVLVGLFSGAILSWIQFKYIWINQKRFEIKFKILDEAAKALALFKREALDPEIQNKKRVYGDGEHAAIVRSIELTKEADVLIKTVLVKTKALYSKKAFQYLDSALKTQFDVKVPGSDMHNDFTEKSDKAIEEMCKDIQKNTSIWFGF